jgi:hypothetical protein
MNAPDPELQKSASKPVSKIAIRILICTLAACILVGCASARSSLGTSDSSCYLALPAATKAVHSHGKLVGVHLYTLATLRKEAPHLYARLSSQHASPQRICVFEFTGRFSKETVARHLGVDSGRLAVVVLKAPSNQLVGTIVLSHPPLRFNHTHIG